MAFWKIKFGKKKINLFKGVCMLTESVNKSFLLTLSSCLVLWLWRQRVALMKESLSGFSFECDSLLDSLYVHVVFIIARHQLQNIPITLCHCEVEIGSKGNIAVYLHTTTDNMISPLFSFSSPIFWIPMSSFREICKWSP